MIYKNIITMSMKFLNYFFILSLIFLSFSFVYADLGSQNVGNSITVSECQGLFAAGFDPHDNLKSSIMGLCLSGIIVNLNKLEQNQCEKIICEYNAARQGLSPIACAKQSAFNTCMIKGGGFEIVEGILIGALRRNIRQVLEDPIAFGISRIQDALKQQVATCPKGVCTSPGSKAASIALAVLELPHVVETVEHLIKQLKSLGSIFDDSACEQLEDIKKELEQLIEEYEFQSQR